MADHCKLLIIYGSQTGQSKSIAEDIKLKAESLNYQTEMLSMDESIEMMPWKSHSFIIFITSSTGDGDPPENAGIFYKKLRSKELSSEYLSHVKYTLLGLGDTNYTTFLGFPKSVEKQLQKLGAKQFYKPGWADDAVGLEIVVDPWIESLWTALSSDGHCNQTNSDEKSSVDLPAPAVSTNVSNNVAELTIVPTASEQTIIDNKEEDLEDSIAKLASLKISVSPLKECDLKVPILPVSYLQLTFDSDITVSFQDIPTEPMPLSASCVFQSKLERLRRLTSESALKTTLEATLNFPPGKIEYKPGDCIGVCCKNPKQEVDALLQRLNLIEKADTPFHLRVKEELKELKSGAKLKYEIPSHIPYPSTLRFVLTHRCEIRSVPRKALIRVLADCTSDDGEKRRLLELCSLQGSEDYVQLVRQPELNVLDFLNTFVSCHPPIERLLEHLPRLLPRPYSLSSSPLNRPSSATFAFNIVEFPEQDGRTYERKGLATGEFDRIFKKMNDTSNEEEFQVSVFLRKNNGFCLPDSTEIPLILVGPGTGVAPFIGFLAHREELLKMNPSLTCGPIWLFYGCRHRDQDYLFKAELERWHSSGILTRLLVTFSREGKPSEPKYVQDLIRGHNTHLVKLIEKGAHVYVCGDATNMAKDVMQAFVSIFQTARDLNEEEAKKKVLQLQMDKRYLQDIWT